MLISSWLYSGNQVKVTIRDGDTVIETDIMPEEEAWQFAKALRSAADDIECAIIGVAPGTLTNTI